MARLTEPKRLVLRHKISQTNKLCRHDVRTVSSGPVAWLPRGPRSSCGRGHRRAFGLERGTRSRRRAAAEQAELGGVRAQRFDHEREVLVERHAEQLGAG